jgi:hypothetical protein
MSADDPRFLEIDEAFDVSPRAMSAVLGSVRSTVVEEDAGELRREASMLSRLEDGIEREESRSRELEQQIQVILGIREDADLMPVDLRYEGKKAAADPVLLQTRTQQLATIGGYCEHLRERVDVLTLRLCDAHKELAEGRRREMSMSTELEQLSMASPRAADLDAVGGEEGGQGCATPERVTELEQEVARLVSKLAARDRAAAQQPAAEQELVRGLKETIASLQERLESEQTASRCSSFS